MFCIYIGDRFYNESKTMMSSIYTREYTEDGKGWRYKRTDWGKVNRSLREGEHVEIYPATKEEIALFEKELKEISAR